MMHEEKKVAKIVEELNMYFFTVGATDIKTEIKKNNTNVIIYMISDYLPEYREQLEELEEYLNEGKDEGMEDFYWELAGCGEPGETNELLLIGAMLDKAYVVINEDRVELMLYKELMEG